MWLAWSLFKKSLRSSLGRLGLICLSVALGVTMLVIYTSFHNAIFQNTSTSLSASLQSAAQEYANNPQDDGRKDGVKPLWFSQPIFSSLLNYQDNQITQYRVEKTDSNIEKIFSIDVPAAGEYYVSPAIKEIMDKYPELGIEKRFGKIYKGELPPEMLYGRDSLTVISGVDGLRSNQEISSFPVYKFQTVLMVNTLPKIISKIIYLGITIVLFPVIMLLIVSAQLGAVQREQRYAALRLSGATGKQIITISLLESIVAATVGILLGIVASFALRPLLSNFTITDTRFFPSQLTLSITQYLLIIAITFLAVIFANSRGLHSLLTSPLGVARRAKKSAPPHFWRLLPLLISITIFTYIVISTKRDAISDTIMFIFISSIFLAMLGLVLASPYLTYLVAKLRTRLTKNTEVYIGGNYVQAHARQISRSVVGVVLALFAGSFFLTSVSGYEDIASRGQNTGYFKNTTVLFNSLRANDSRVGTALQKILADPKQDYIQSATEVKNIFGAVTFAPCQKILPYLQNFSCRGNYVGINFYSNRTSGEPVVQGSETEVREYYIKHENAADSIEATPAYFLSLRQPTDIEKLRSDLAELIPLQSAPDLLHNTDYSGTMYNSTNRMLVYITYFGIIVTLLVAIVSLSVSTYSSLLERQRSLLTLRLAGMETKRMRRMVLVESFYPLGSISFIAAGTGIGMGYFLIKTLSHSMTAEITPLYLGVVGGALLLAGLIIWLISSTIKRITQLSVNRME